MKTPLFERRLIAALTWIVRLPLLGDIELARLMEIDEIDARHLRTELDRRGWVEWVAPRVAELDERRRAALLRAEALADLATCSGFGAQEIARRAPVSNADLLERLPRIATVTGVNWLLSKLAAGLRERGEMTLDDACSLPLSSTKPWWPNGVDAYGVVRGGRGAARFFVAWDRAGAPDLHRRDRIAKWAGESRSADPSVIFIVCADTHAHWMWDAELRRNVGMPEVRLTTAQELLNAGPRAAIWSTPGSSVRLWFEQALSSQSSDIAPLLTFPASMQLPERRCGTPGLRAWATTAAVLDEATRTREEAWHAVYSTLTKTGGPVRIIGNVKGRRNWAYLLARRAQAGEPDMHYACITAYDAVEAGVLDARVIEAAQSQLPEDVFKELYLAEPSDDAGNPFGLAAIRACIAPLSTKPPRVWGWDLGKSIDYTVGIALDEDGAVCRFERFKDSWESIERRLRAAVGSTRALVDGTGVGDVVVERLHGNASNIDGFTFTSKSKQQLMEGLQVAIQSGEVHFPAGPIGDELETFEYESTRTSVLYSAPPGLHDDCVVALALAVQHARLRGEVRIRWIG